MSHNRTDAARLAELDQLLKSISTLETLIQHRQSGGEKTTLADIVNELAAARAEPAPETLTVKEKELLQFIRDHRYATGVSPTITEMSEMLGRSKGTLTDLIDGLIKKGALRRTGRRKARSLEPVHEEAIPREAALQAVEKICQKVKPDEPVGNLPKRISKAISRIPSIN